MYFCISTVKGSIPYKAVNEVKIQIEGLPDLVLPLRRVSNYGEEKL